MSAELHRIEALPGEGRYAVTFRLPGGTEQTAIVHLAGDHVEVAEASLPPGPTRESAVFAATVAVVRAFAAANDEAGGLPSLRDVEGGWDVGLGNVVLGDGGLPTCTAHGEMPLVEKIYTCAECGARAQFG